MRAAICVCVVLALARVAAAYPQFQLSKDQTCTSCHISPAGGLLLNENGLAVAENISTFGGAPEFLHGKLTLPDWVQLGGDARGAAGVNVDRGARPAAFPMQADADVALRGHGLTCLATVGAQSTSYVIGSPEHWLMWQPDASSSEGLFVRVGRFMPVYGLRFAEHTAYTRRYGQTPLYGETYGLAVAYVEPQWEVHVTGFVHDPIQDAIERGDGGAGYAEARFAKFASLGVEARYARSDEDSRLAGGVTGKSWIAPAEVLLEAEVQLVRQRFLQITSERTQLVSYLLATWFVTQGWMLDLGIGQFDEDLHVKNLDLEAIDANLHWFTTSHWELVLNTRIQTIALGAGGETSGYVLVQGHYRL